MAEITAALVKELREKTGAGMMDCKRALAETGGDLEAAIDWLRKKGLSAAAKKAGRTAAEGLVGVKAEASRAAIVEVNAETDFVARNETFQGFVAACAALALEAGGDVEALKAKPFPGSGRSVAEELTHLIATIGENMAIRRTAVLSVPKGWLRPMSTPRSSPSSAVSACSSRWRASRASRSSRSAGRSACMSPPPDPSSSTSLRSIRPRWRARGRC